MAAKRLPWNKYERLVIKDDSEREIKKNLFGVVGAKSVLPVPNGMWF